MEGKAPSNPGREVISESAMLALAAVETKASVKQKIDKMNAAKEWSMAKVGIVKGPVRYCQLFVLHSYPALQ